MEPSCLRRSSARAAASNSLVAFGRRVLELRESAGMTQEGLARAAGLHWTYIGQIERGERNHSYKNILKLARGLGISAGDLLRGVQ
jgi:transcriptional regulator with XRE-family HTH domain